MEKDLDILFRKYFDNELSKDEKARLEARLESDKAFKEEFDDYELGKLAGERLLYNDIAARVKSSSLSIDTDTRPPLIRRMYVRASSVAAILLLGIIAIYCFNQNTQPDEIFTDYYAQPSYSTTRSAEQNTDDRNKLILAFKNSEFSEVLEIYGTLDSVSQAQLSNRRLIAHTYLQLGQDKEALDRLRASAREGSDEQKILDQWYLGLIHLKSERIDSANHYLEKVASQETFLYQNDAKKILKKIKNF